jgi:hypothetical protein
METTFINSKFSWLKPLSYCSDMNFEY